MKACGKNDRRSTTVVPNQFLQVTSELQNNMKQTEICSSVFYSSSSGTHKQLPLFVRPLATISTTPMEEKTGGLGKRMADDGLGAEQKRKKT